MNALGPVETLITGVVAIGLLTAIGLHAAGIAKVTQSAGQAGSGLIHTAEKG